MTKTLAELKALCATHDLAVPLTKRPAKEPYIRALRDHLWVTRHPQTPIPEQIEPMLLGDWDDLDCVTAGMIERDGSDWCLQEKEDGVRATLHVTEDGVRITGRTISEVTFRLSEFASNLPHLTRGFGDLNGTVLDGELVCRKSDISTGGATTAHPLQAAVAVLSTTPENATAMQEGQGCRLNFVAFDILRFRGSDITAEPLRNRLPQLEEAVLRATNPHLELVETHFADKALVHELTIMDGKEGTVWKRLDQPYEPGKRVRHWLKRKRSVEVEAVVTGFKLGSPGRGNADSVGAVEFSTVEPGGVTSPIGWVSNWTDGERERMTRRHGGHTVLDPAMFGRKAIIRGQDVAPRSGRYRHARIIRWVD